MNENDIAKKVLDICFKIHQQYGPGLMESVYEEILCYELRKLGMKVNRQQSVPLIHDGIVIKIAFRADLIVNDIVLIELKSVDELAKNYYKKTLTYIKLTNIKLGLLINFGSNLMRNGIHRIVNGL